MADKEIFVDVNNIRTTKKKIDDKYSELNEMFNHYKQMIEDTKNVYNTESATYFRDICAKYMDLNVSYLKNIFKEYVDSLDDICKIYENRIQNVSKRIN